LNILCILTSKCASRHNGIYFFMFQLASRLLPRRFSEPTFGPPWTTHHWKAHYFAPFLPFRGSGSSFFWLFVFWCSLF
jgi:hypothetical protein